MASPHDSVASCLRDGRLVAMPDRRGHNLARGASRCVTLAVHSDPIWAAHHITGIRFARVDKNRDRGWRGPTRCLLDDLERKLACAKGGHHEPPSLIGRVGLVVAPAAERDQQI
jgi:hypothetical protein